MQLRDISLRLDQSEEVLDQIIVLSKVRSLDSKLKKDKESLTKMSSESSGTVPLLLNDSLQQADRLLEKTKKMILVNARDTSMSSEAKPGKKLQELPSDLISHAFGFLSMRERGRLRPINKKLNKAICKSVIYEDFVSFSIIQNDPFIVAAKSNNSTNVIFENLIEDTRAKLERVKNDVIIQVKEDAEEKSRDAMERRTRSGQCSPIVAIPFLLMMGNSFGVAFLIQKITSSIENPTLQGLSIAGVVIEGICVFLIGMYLLFKIGSRACCCTPEPGEQRDVTFGAAPFFAGRTARKQAEEKLEYFLNKSKPK